MKSLLLLMSTVLLLAQEPVAIGSHYECRGVNPDGTRYTLALDIDRQEENYFLRWADGAQLGIGLRDGDWLAVAFVNVSLGATSVALYQIRPGQLVGRWADGDGHLLREECLAGQPAAAWRQFGHDS